MGAVKKGKTKETIEGDGFEVVVTADFETYEINNPELKHDNLWFGDATVFIAEVDNRGDEALSAAIDTAFYDNEGTLIDDDITSESFTDPFSTHAEVIRELGVAEGHHKETIDTIELTLNHLDRVDSDQWRYAGFNPNEINRLFIDGSIADAADPDEDEKYHGRVIEAQGQNRTINLIVDGTGEGQEKEVRRLSNALWLANRVNLDKFTSEYDTVQFEVNTEIYAIEFEVTSDMLETYNEEREDPEIDSTIARINYSNMVLDTMEGVPA